jgi:hypothetical protein
LGVPNASSYENSFAITNSYEGIIAQMLCRSTLLGL